MKDKHYQQMMYNMQTEGAQKGKLTKFFEGWDYLQLKETTDPEYKYNPNIVYLFAEHTLMKATQADAKKHEQRMINMLGVSTMKEQNMAHTMSFVSVFLAKFERIYPELFKDEVLDKLPWQKLLPWFDEKYVPVLMERLHYGEPSAKNFLLPSLELSASAVTRIVNHYGISTMIDVIVGAEKWGDMKKRNVLNTLLPHFDLSVFEKLNNFPPNLHWQMLNEWLDEAKILKERQDILQEMPDKPESKTGRKI